MKIIAIFEESDDIGFLLNPNSLKSYGNNTQHYDCQRYVLICKFFFLLPNFTSDLKAW